jgi:hypothetical protein
MSEDLKAEIEGLKAENENLKNKKSTEGSLSMKVSEKVRYRYMEWVASQ